MKTPWLLPVLALAVTAPWMVYQKRTAATLEREIAVVTGRIRTFRALAPDEGTGLADKDDPLRQPAGRIDWKMVTTKLHGLQGGGMADLQIKTRLQKKLLEMSPDALEAQLDELAAMGLEKETLQSLESMILGILTNKDPKRVIERLGSGDWQQQHSWPMSSALRRWADEQPGAAAIWLDQQIAAGKLDSKSLDGRSHSRFLMEGALMNALMKNDPTAASARVAALPEEQRQDFLQMFQHFQPAANDAAYAGVVRDNLPEPKAAEVLANMAGMLANRQGYERVDRLIAASQATEAEKNAIVAAVIKGRMNANGELQTETLDEARQWAAGQAPGTADRATGEVLATSLQRGADAARIASLVLEYNGRSPNDEVLVSFLRQSAAGPARNLIDSIKDPATREQIRSLPHFANPP